MKVYLLCRTIEHPQSLDSNAPQLGDIVQMRRTDKPLAKLELKFFTVVKVDLVIPCEEKFKGPDFAGMCRVCKDNDITKCEFQKYMIPEFDTGSLEDEPRILKKRRYKAVYTPPVNIKNKIDEGLAKSEKDEAAILLWADTNEQLKTIIVDKVK